MSAWTALIVVIIPMVVVACIGGDGAETPPAPTVQQSPAATATATATAPQSGRAAAAPSDGRTVDGPGVLYTFNGTPSAPESLYDLPNWDVQVHSRDKTAWKELEPMAAEHGPGCEGPTMTHELTAYEDAVFRCRDHFMTSINAGGYGMVYLTPPELLDFSGGEAVVSFRISTFVASQRDWWDVWITPFEDNLALPLEDWLPDVQGEPRNAIHVRLGAEMQICARVLRDFKAQDSPTCRSYDGYNKFLTPDRARRDLVEIRVSQGNIRVGMPDYDFWWEDWKLQRPIEWTQGVVQLGHHSYNPRKCNDGTHDCPAHAPGTWHWDEVRISPSVPFGITRATVRTAGEDESVRFASPATDGAYLRFSGIGVPDVTFDGGRTWVEAKRQAEEVHRADHFSTYWMPIPAGTEELKIRFARDDWYQGPFLAKDFAIWTPPATNP